MKIGKRYKRMRLFREFCKVSSSIKSIQMRSSLLALALALVASANAASFSKRDVTPAVQTCIKDLTAAQSQLTIVATAVS
ncbi:hypothetical protein RMCBS344292_12705 [Rhizopus microsporus]|nr:hypothetical protein RMCBS344292_12705 [Rhizopus microsporus]